jgi:hypothetical protein
VAWRIGPPVALVGRAVSRSVCGLLVTPVGVDNSLIDWRTRANPAQSPDGTQHHDNGHTIHFAYAHSRNREFSSPIRAS